MTEIFHRIMEFSVYGAIWITLLYFVSRFLKKYGVLWQYIIMCCIACHMLVPIHVQWVVIEIPSLSSDSGVVSKPDSMALDTAQQGNPADQADTVLPETDDVQEDITEISGGAEYPQVSETKEGEPSTGNQKYSLIDTAKTAVMNFQNNAKMRLAGKQYQHIVFILELVWFCGMILAFCKTILEYVAFRYRMVRWQLPVDASVWQTFLCQKKVCHVKRRIDLVCSREVASPMLCGVIRPVIIVPVEDYSERDYGYIFRHELWHYRHGDILFKGIFTACKCIYWFHPLVHRMVRHACENMELLCDEAVVRGVDHEEKQAYSMMILRHTMQEKVCPQIPLTTSFYGGKEYMKTRLLNIMTGNKKRMGIGLILLILLAMIGFGGVKYSMAVGKQGENPDVVKSQKTASGKETDQNKIQDQYILVVGVDNIGAGTSNADAILLAHVDEDKGVLEIRNIPRMLEVDYTKVAKSHAEYKNLGKLGKTRIGAAYTIGGVDALAAAVEEQYQVSVASHVVSGYETVRQAIDAVGGVELTLTKKEAKYLNSTNYISQKKNRNVKVGQQTLNGDQTMGYLRIRGSEAGSPVVDGQVTKETGEFARARRAQNVVQSFGKQLKKQKLDVAKIVPEILSTKWDTVFDLDIETEDVITLLRGIVSGKLEVQMTTETADDLTEQKEGTENAESGAGMSEQTGEAASGYAEGVPSQTESPASESKAGLSMQKDMDLGDGEQDDGSNIETESKSMTVELQSQ